jgi:hypothetical protein
MSGRRPRALTAVLRRVATAPQRTAFKGSLGGAGVNRSDRTGKRDVRVLWREFRGTLARPSRRNGCRQGRDPSVSALEVVWSVDCGARAVRERMMAGALSFVVVPFAAQASRELQMREPMKAAGCRAGRRSSRRPRWRRGWRGRRRAWDTTPLQPTLPQRPNLRSRLPPRLSVTKSEGLAVSDAVRTFTKYEGYLKQKVSGVAAAHRRLFPNPSCHSSGFRSAAAERWRRCRNAIG